MGDQASAAQWREWLRKGAAAFDAKLWNGEYYSLWVDGPRRDECCMSDQLSGEWYTQLMGLGQSLPRERVVAALRAVVAHNFTPEQGLINASYPAGAPARFPTFENPQASGNWTGIEYAFASMLMDFGLVEEGVAVVRAVADRYARAGRIWNHEECGDHYYRAMCSWTTLLAATGFKVDAARGELTLAPVIRVPEVRAPWVSATAWGEFTQSARRFELSCRSGSMTIRRLRLNLQGRALAARLGGRRVPAALSEENGYRVLAFGAPVALAAGATLTVSA
jgi:Glycosyl-hydrolase family 116, catalytic region